MLSRKDIENELGKGINISPFHNENVKGNSINLTISRNAWTLGRGQVFRGENGKVILADKMSSDLKR